ncbi:MAG TPA: hypothetical protein VHC69_14365 [Polyangiaceae bacterium]|nr:hypothetical protein [Polyangiaceae bacterium]
MTKRILSTKTLTRKTATTRTVGLVRGKRSRRAASKAEKPATPTTLDEAKALVARLEKERADGIFAKSRRDYAERTAAARLLFAPRPENDGNTIADRVMGALAGEWKDPADLAKWGLYHLQSELHVAETLLTKMWATMGKRHGCTIDEDELHSIIELLRGIRERMRAVNCFAPMLKEAAEDGAS